MLNISNYVLLGVTLAFFGFVGLRRGVNRELLSLIGIALGLWLAGSLAVAVKAWVNLFFKLGRLALSGGFTADDPMSAWGQLRDQADLVQSPSQEQFLTLVVFVVIVLLFYQLGQQRIPPPEAFILRLLGLLAGGINGFLIAYYLLPLLFPTPTTVINVPTGELRAALNDSQTVAVVIVFFVVVLIGFGLYSASVSKKKS